MKPAWTVAGRRRRMRGSGRLGLLTAVAVAFAGCAVDADGVLRPTTAGEVSPSLDESIEANAGACGDLLTSVQESALAVVGPDGLPSADPFNRFNDFRGRGLVVVDRGFGFDDGQEEATTLPIGAADAVVLGERIVIVRDGWLHVLDGSADEPIHSSWLGTVTLGESPMLVEDGDGILIIHETNATIGGQSGRAVRVARVTIDEVNAVTIEESVEILGSLAGADLEGDTLQLAVRRAAPDLDLVTATTIGAEAAAIEVNRMAIEATTVDDWVPILRHRSGDGEPVDGLVGDCDVVTPPGSDTALGTTALLHHTYGASLGEMAGELVMGEGLVSFDGDNAWLLSSRNTVVGAGGEGPGGIGLDRVVAVRLAAGDDGYEAEAAGIVAGHLQTPAGIAVGDDGLMMFTSEDRWHQQLTITSLGGETELTHLDSRDLNLDWWGVLTTSFVGDTLVMSRQGASAIVDLTQLDDLQIETRTTRWNAGNRIAAAQIVPFADDFLAISGGQIVDQWGSIEVFFEQVVGDDFGGAPRLEDWFGQPGEVSADIRRGGTDSDDVVASWTAEAFGLWEVSSDPDADSVILGVAGLRDPDNPPILGGELFTGAISFDISDGEFVEQDRITFAPSRPDNIGASDCVRAEVDQFFLDVAGLWNAQLFTCEPGVGAGVVGYTCTGAEFGEIDPQILAWNWGIDDTSEIEAELAALRAVIDDGGTVIACRAKPPVEVDAPISELTTATGDLWLTTTTGVALWEPGAEEISVLSLEPPYGE